jgi:hypothetical protein
MPTILRHTIAPDLVAAYLPKAWLATRIGRRLKGSRQAGT